MIKDKITNIQMGFLLFSVMVGVGILSLPQQVANQAGVDGWIVIILSGILAAVSALLMAKIGERFPEKSLIEYGPVLIGKPMGIMLCLLFLIYFIVFASTVTRISADVTKLYLLDDTPVEVVILSTFLTSTLIVLHGINAIARFNQFIQPIILFLLILVLLLTFSGADLGNNLPILGDGIQPIISSLPSTSFSFLGFEAILFLLPFMKTPQKSTRVILVAFSIVIFLYVFIVIACVSVLGAKEVGYVNYPTLTIAKNIQFPGSFIERVESIMMISWVPFALTTLLLLHYCSSLILAKLLGLKEHRVISILLIPVVYMLAVLPQNVLEVEQWSQGVGAFGASLNLVTIAVLWLGYGVNKRRGRI